MADRGATTGGPGSRGSNVPSPRDAKATSPKEVKAQAKAAKQAEKARRRASDDPRDMGRLRQIKVAYNLTHEHDRALPWVLLAAGLAPVVVALVVGLLWDHLVYLLVLGVLFGVLAAMILLARRARGATYKRYAGQTGSAEVALQMLPRQWVSTPVIAVTKSRDVVHRTLGPGGLVLIGEGEPGRVRQLLASEVRKHERVAYGVTVHTVVMGDKEGQVPLSRLADHIRKLPKSLQPHQVTDVKARLRALDAVRPPVGMPKGPMPTSPRQVRGARQSMRGR